MTTYNKNKINSVPAAHLFIQHFKRQRSHLILLHLHMTLSCPASHRATFTVLQIAFLNGCTTIRSLARRVSQSMYCTVPKAPFLHCSSCVVCRSPELGMRCGTKSEISWRILHNRRSSWGSMVVRALLLLLWLKKIQNEKRDSEVGFHYFFFTRKTLNW